MLIFLAAMQGFCLTHDLFNLFVWFEVMSVTAFALTAYRLEADPLEEALNFTVTNSIGSFLILGGIALAYSLAGVLVLGAPHARAARSCGAPAGSSWAWAHDLGRSWLPRSWLRLSDQVFSGPMSAAIDRTHDGVIGDYVVWILIGLALFSVSSAAALYAG